MNTIKCLLLPLKMLAFLIMAILMMPFAICNYQWWRDGYFSFLHKCMDEAESLNLASKEEIDEIRKEIK